MAAPNSGDSCLSADEQMTWAYTLFFFFLSLVFLKKEDRLLHRLFVLSCVYLPKSMDWKCPCKMTHPPIIPTPIQNELHSHHHHHHRNNNNNKIRPFLWWLYNNNMTICTHTHRERERESRLMTKQYPDVSDDGQELYICKTCQTIIYSTLSVCLSVHVCEILLHYY